MPNYEYKALNPEGRTLTSVLMAPDVEDVKRQLQDMQMMVISIKEIKSAKTTDHFKLNVKESLILHFTKAEKAIYQKISLKKNYLQK